VLCAVGGTILHRLFKVGDGIDRTDGLLDVCVWNPPNVAAIVTCLAWIGVGRPGRSRWLVQSRGKGVYISADRAVAFEVDGDVVGSLPVEIEMLDQQITVLTPW
jgi:diacylglycerol kinase family enzyme